MSRPSLTLVTYLWNGEKYGFPWVELVCEGLAECDAVIVANPESDEGDATRAKLRAWAAREPRLKVIEMPEKLQSLRFPTAVNLAIAAAKTEYVLHLDSDEAMDLSGAHFWGLFGVGEVARLLHEGWTVAFPRLDFTCSSSHVTPIFEGEPPVVRLMARDQFPTVCSMSDAMHLGGGKQVYVHEAAPIFHYHGLASEGGWQGKEVAFQARYADIGLPVDPRLTKGWEAWDGPLSRARPNTQPHPKGWRPYLARAEMTTRDLMRTSDSRQVAREGVAGPDTEAQAGLGSRVGTALV